MNNNFLFFLQKLKLKCSRKRITKGKIKMLKIENRNKRLQTTMETMTFTNLMFIIIQKFNL